MTNIYYERRQRLIKLLPPDTGALIFSGEEIPLGVDMTYPFSVDKNYYYLTGLDIPDSAVYISGEGTILFLPPFDPKREAYEGTQLTWEQMSQIAGCNEVKKMCEPEELVDSITGADTLYLDLQRNYGALISPPAVRARKKALAAGKKTENVYSMIYALRSVKDEVEISKIRRAVDITGESLTYMVQNCRSGMREYEWQAAFEYGLRRCGCETSFPSIVASGKNAVYLHYVRNDAIVNAGEMFLFDVGAYFEHYSSDISRTYPVGGKFTDRQRELYELVYDATRLVLEHMKPHKLYRDHVVALHDFFNKYLMPMHIVETEIEKENFLHMMSRGCCHHLGLDAHDAYAALDDELLPGMVFTKEPGVYLKHEGIGIRIEEDLLITENGNELLSKNIPSAPDDIINILA
jgi:Xaa-Pro aminopeptidase